MIGGTNDWGTSPPDPLCFRLCQDPCLCLGWIGGPWLPWAPPSVYAHELTMARMQE